MMQTILKWLHLLGGRGASGRFAPSKLGALVPAARRRPNLKFIGIHWFGSFVPFVYVKLFGQLFSVSWF